MTQKEIKFLHVRQYKEDPFDRLIVDTMGGKTIAYTVHEESTKTFVTYFVQRCFWKDHYNKAIGRQVASGRFRSDKYKNTQLTIPSGANPVEAIFKDIGWVAPQEPHTDKNKESAMA